MNDIFYTAHLMGGLGNQMFQIANAICQGKKNNVNVIFDNEFVNWNTPNRRKPISYRDSIYRNLTFSSIKSELIRVEEQTWNTANLNFNTQKSTEFYGYFQSSNNFLGYDSNIRDLFCPTQEFISRMNSKYSDSLNGNTLSVHIRRSDYLTISRILPVVDASYIEKAIQTHGYYDNLFIFSDDKEWVRNNLNLKNSVVVDGLDDYEELWLMSMCKNNIISNSTFSWWASFLNSNTYKKVYAPSIWFGPDWKQDYNNIYEKYWNVIEVVYKDGYLKAK